MTKNIFIATAEPYSGKSIVALGLVDMLLNKAQKIGYFKPIVDQDPKEGKDVHIETIVKHFNLAINYEDAYAFTREEANTLAEAGKQGDIIETIIAKYKKLEENYDFTVVEGSDFLGEGIAFEFDANVSIAKNLGAPVIIVVSGDGKSNNHLTNAVLTIIRNFQTREVQVLAVVANKVSPENVEGLRNLLTPQLSHGIILSVIPDDVRLKSPTLHEVQKHIKGKVLFGEQHLSNQADHFIFGAMQVPNFLNHIKENVLIVTPGDRADIIISSLQANLSYNYPKISGIVITGGFEPAESVFKLIDGLHTIVPIIAVQEGSFPTATKIGAIRSRITPDNHKKIYRAITAFKKYVDVKALDEKIITFKPEGMTPHMFQYQLLKWARAEKKTYCIA